MNKEQQPNWIKNCTEAYEHIFNYNFNKQPQVALVYYYSINRLHREFREEYELSELETKLQGMEKRLKEAYLL